MSENANLTPETVQPPKARAAKKPIVPLSERAAYSPAEFAALFGREQTWGYRMIYCGAVRIIAGMRPTMIPRSEVERLSNDRETFGGTAAKHGPTAQPDTASAE